MVKNIVVAEELLETVAEEIGMGKSYKLLKQLKVQT